MSISRGKGKGKGEAEEVQLGFSESLSALVYAILLKSKICC